MNAIALTISNIPVRQDAFGRYCLNDLHKAAGGEEKNSPNRFTRSDNYQSLIDELTPDLAFTPVESVRGGKNPGTYGCKEIVYSYAMWISAKFHIAVIRAYDALVTSTRYGLLELPEPPAITNAQAGQLFNTVNSIAGDDNKIRASIWSRFQKHFELNSYKVLPADRFDEAVEYLEQRRDEYRDGAKLFYISDRELEALVAERAKAIEGEIMDKPPTNPTINIDLNMPEGMRQLTVSFNSQPVLGGRWSMWHSGDQLVIRPMANNEFITSSENLADVIADSMGMAVHSKDLPSICRAAAQRMESRQLK